MTYNIFWFYSLGRLSKIKNQKFPWFSWMIFLLVRLFQLSHRKWIRRIFLFCQFQSKSIKKVFYWITFMVFKISRLGHLRRGKAISIAGPESSMYDWTLADIRVWSICSDFGANQKLNGWSPFLVEYWYGCPFET